MTKQHIQQGSEVINTETGEALKIEEYVDFVEPEVQETSNRQLMKFDASDLSAIHGLHIDGNLSFPERVKVLKMVTSFIGGESNRIDRWLNVPISVCGVVMHDVQVRLEDKVGPNGEDIYIPRTRTVIMVEGANGRPFNEMVKIAFVAKSADSFFKQTVIPLLGLGIWQSPINMIVRKTTSRRGNAYSFEIVD